MAQVEAIEDQAHISKSSAKGRLIVVSNRVSVPTVGNAPSAGGLAVAIEDALKTRGGIWFGWSGKICANSDVDPQVQFHARGPISYAVMDLSRRDIDEYYHGFSNRVLWPICHYRLDLAELSRRDVAGYFRVNEMFARRLVKLLEPDDTVWIHDYHLIPLAGFLRQFGCTNRIGFFLHIPWPPHEMATALPSFERILRDFAAYDLIGMQTPNDVDNFLGCMAHAKVATTSGNGMCEANGRSFRVSALPISIDTVGFGHEAQLADRNAIVRRTRASLEGRQLVIGVDRLDYSKGIRQRIDAFSTFIERSPEAAKARITMLQITPKSRSDIPEYVDMQREVAEHVGQINGKLGDVDWTPIRYSNKTLSRSALAGLYRFARVGLVTPLRDGMNLVAKEYVAAQSPDDPGVLILSRFAGAAYELKSALIVNPYDVESTATAISRAFEMSLDERRSRWSEMMEILRINTIDAWVQKFLQQLSGGSSKAAENESPLKRTLAPESGIVSALASHEAAPDKDVKPLLPDLSPLPALAPTALRSVNENGTQGGSWLTSALSRFSLSH
jgi:trehalose 6-phosphate synthase